MAEQFAKLVGFEELKKKLALLPDRIARNVLRGAVNAGATQIRKRVVQNAYATFNIHTPSTLIASIYQKQIRELSGLKAQFFHISCRKGKKFGKLVQGKYSAGDRTNPVDAFYARFLEFGTSKMSARPFMRPAFETEKDNAKEAVRAYLEKRIPDEIAKL